MANEKKSKLDRSYTSSPRMSGRKDEASLVSHRIDISLSGSEQSPDELKISEVAGIITPHQRKPSSSVDNSIQRFLPSP